MIDYDALSDDQVLLLGYDPRSRVNTIHPGQPIREWFFWGTLVSIPELALHIVLRLG